MKKNIKKFMDLRNPFHSSQIFTYAESSQMTYPNKKNITKQNTTQHRSLEYIHKRAFLVFTFSEFLYLVLIKLEGSLRTYLGNSYLEPATINISTTLLHKTNQNKTLWKNKIIPFSS